MANNERISPIINRKRKSTLNSKKVDIAGVGDFGRDSSSSESKESPQVKENNSHSEPTSADSSKTKTSQIQNVEKEGFDMRKKATKTQKMSPDVILKINTLKPYIKDLEELETEGTPSINDIVNMLLDNYINTKLSTRQLQGYKAVYQNLFEQL
ncbi:MULTISPECIES: hypothetical protein [Listeria]|uniref:hypothetical protein n=1 Tax=Listeria TaxID=1637 RepID=UPI000B58E3D7